MASNLIYFIDTALGRPPLFFSQHHQLFIVLKLDLNIVYLSKFEYFINKI